MSRAYATLRSANGIMFSMNATLAPSALVHGARPLGVALCEVVVDRHEVHAGPRQRVEEERLRGDERLALAGLHLGDVALVEDDAAHHLHLEELDLAVAAEGLADRRVRLEEQLLERLAVLEPLLELGGLALSSASESFSNSG